MAVILAFFALFAAAPVAKNAFEQTSLCAVVAKPYAFNGKLVRFRAGIVTDWHHGTVLVHSGCARGIELSSTDAVPADESKALDEAIGTPLDGGRERAAMATFTGRFSLRRGVPQSAFDNQLKFSAERIERVDVYRKKYRR